MKQIVIIGMVLLMAACGGQAPKTETQQKDSIVTARDVAEQKLEQAVMLADSLTQAYEQLAKEEAEQAAYVIENATKLAEDAPEVVRLNEIRLQLADLQSRKTAAEGQVKYLKRQLNIED